MFINMQLTSFRIFIIEMSINFLLQAVRILHIGKCADDEINIIYDYFNKLDNDDLINYFKSNSVLQYDNDLEFCTEIINKLIKIFEEKEEYEKCIVLMVKKNEIIKITNVVDSHEYI